MKTKIGNFEYRIGFEIFRIDLKSLQAVKSFVGYLKLFNVVARKTELVTLSMAKIDVLKNWSLVKNHFTIGMIEQTQRWIITTGKCSLLNLITKE